jgi:hypothetical protein
MLGKTLLRRAIASASPRFRATAICCGVWIYLRDKGADPLSRDMLALKDLELGINGLVEKARKFDQLEAILNDTNDPDRRVIERLAEAFYSS